MIKIKNITVYPDIESDMHFELTAYLVGFNSSNIKDYNDNEELEADYYKYFYRFVDEFKPNNVHYKLVINSSQKMYYIQASVLEDDIEKTVNFIHSVVKTTNAYICKSPNETDKLQIKVNKLLGELNNGKS